MTRMTRSRSAEGGELGRAVARVARRRLALGVIFVGLVSTGSCGRADPTHPGSTTTGAGAGGAGDGGDFTAFGGGDDGGSGPVVTDCTEGTACTPNIECFGELDQGICCENHCTCDAKGEYHCAVECADTCPASLPVTGSMCQGTIACSTFDFGLCAPTCTCDDCIFGQWRCSLPDDCPAQPACDPPDGIHEGSACALTDMVCKGTCGMPCRCVNGSWSCQMLPWGVVPCEPHVNPASCPSTEPAPGGACDPGPDGSSCVYLLPGGTLGFDECTCDVCFGDGCEGVEPSWSCAFAGFG